MEGWRSDRLQFDERVKNFKESDDVKAVKRECQKEKTKLRNALAAVKGQLKDMSFKYAESCKEYEGRLQAQMARVLDAEYRGKEGKRVARRKSEVMVGRVEGAGKREEEAKRRAEECEGEVRLSDPAARVGEGEKTVERRNGLSVIWRREMIISGSAVTACSDANTLDISCDSPLPRSSLLAFLFADREAEGRKH